MRTEAEIRKRIAYLERLTKLSSLSVIAESAIQEIRVLRWVLGEEAK